MKGLFVFITLIFCPAPFYSQTYMIEAEKFQFRGGWKEEKDDEAYSNSILMVTSGGGNVADALTVVEVKQNGEYTFWSRTKDFKKQSPKTRISRLIIDENALDEQGKHGLDGFHWERVGRLQLSKGRHVISLRDVAANYARLDAVFFTQDDKIDPNCLNYRQLKRYLIEPLPVKMENQKAGAISFKPKILSQDTESVGEISGNFLRMRLIRSGKDLIQKSEVFVNQNWESLDKRVADHILLLMKSKNPGINFSLFHAAWTGVEAKYLNVDGKKYPVYDPVDMLNPYLAGNLLTMDVFDYEQLDNHAMKVFYKTNQNDTITSIWSVKDDNYFFDVSFEYEIKDSQYYSLVVAAFQGLDPERVDRVLLSPMYQFKRLPETPKLLPMSLIPQPIAIVETNNLSYFVTGNPVDFSRNWGMNDMGFSLKNVENKVQPVVFSPILGLPDSYYKVGSTLTKSFKIGMIPAQWHNALQYASDSIFLVSDYRSQSTSLNNAVFNIINLLKNDQAAGWEKNMKGFLDIESNPAQRTEVVQTAPLALLAASIITQDEDLYIRRALPGIEYMLSRKGYRWGYPNERDPQTETKVNTFTPFKSEFNTGHFAGLHHLLRGKNPWLVDLAMPNGLPRYSKGYGVDETWTGDLAAYHLTGDQKWLIKASIGANHMISNELYSNPSKPVYTWMFYNAQVYPQWFDLLDLYEATKDKSFFYAACYGAYFTIAGQRSYPLMQNAKMTIHKNGEYRGNANIFWRKGERFKLGYPRKKGDVEERVVDDKLLSPVGLGFEQPMTFFSKSDNINHVFMSSWAPSLLRLNSNHTYPFFETYARNSIIGRFASYPGYYAAGYTDLPLDSIYPYKGPDVTSMYYHHIPSHLSLTMDYLITEAIQRSKSVVDFPYVKQQGFVWFNNRVYGGRKGRVLHDSNVELIIKKGLLSVSSESVNYLTGFSNENFWLILMNEDNNPQSIKIRFNTPMNTDTVAVRYYYSQTTSLLSEEISCIDNTLKVNIDAKGIIFISIPIKETLPRVNEYPVKDGFKIVDIGNNKLFLFRIRSPFGWDSVYGYVNSALPQGMSIKLDVETNYLPDVSSAYKSQFPMEWTFLKLDRNKGLTLSLMLKKGEKIIERKRIAL